MVAAIDWIQANKDWLFSGLGVLVVTVIINFFRRNRRDSTQTIESGDNSSNYQAGRDLVVGPAKTEKNGKKG